MSPAPVACDALVIGAGPAGTTAAIALALVGWDVVLVEQHAYPRRKVCGECLSADAARRLDALGVDAAAFAGPRHVRLAWYRGDATVQAPFPPAAGADPRHAYGYALGRDKLDLLLVARAARVGVAVLQPARVRTVRGAMGAHDVEIVQPGRVQRLQTRVVIDAHGSWERGPTEERAAVDARATGGGRPAVAATRIPPHAADLFAFKATFRGGDLEPGCLPVLAYEGGYGGLVLGDDGRVTLAGCLRRDALRSARSRTGLPAGEAFEAHLRAACRGVRHALAGAAREGDWLTVGPLRPGARVDAPGETFAVGNAAGETHPIVGEGIAMALQSAALLGSRLTRHRPCELDRALLAAIRRDYALAWHRQFRRRLRVANACAQLAMRPALAHAATRVLARRPMLLARVARLAGKAAPLHIEGTVDWPVDPLVESPVGLLVDPLVEPLVEPPVEPPDHPLRGTA